MKYLSKKQILILHEQLIQPSGGIKGIRDDGMLDSSMQTPLQVFNGQELYPSIIQKATRLAFGIIKNYPFIDGNKRISTHAMLIFLELNGIELFYLDDEIITIILDIASSKLSENDLYIWIESYQK
ncbi:death-on-curing family protein [[Eubacterium] yurii subsp. margaretiae ATCC 43715]|nr:death-on-curing family protein [[Eubacterium] yurii subsp. margaretiae ATCC 43715]